MAHMLRRHHGRRHHKKAHGRKHGHMRRNPGMPKWVLPVLGAVGVGALIYMLSKKKAAAPALAPLPPIMTVALDEKTGMANVPVGTRLHVSLPTTSKKGWAAMPTIDTTFGDPTLLAVVADSRFPGEPVFQALKAGISSVRAEYYYGDVAAPQDLPLTVVIS
jgi:hypothetical protein